MDRRIEVIYCDDVRMELGGKLSFMGVYRSELFASGFPIVLSKFCIHMSAFTPIADPFQELIFRILKDDDILAEIPVHEDKLKAIAQAAPEDDEEGITIIRVGINFVPLELNGPCKLRIRVVTEAEELKGLSLDVSLRPNS